MARIYVEIGQIEPQVERMYQKYDASARLAKRKRERLLKRWLSIAAIRLSKRWWSTTVTPTDVYFKYTNFGWFQPPPRVGGALLELKTVQLRAGSKADKARSILRACRVGKRNGATHILFGQKAINLVSANHGGEE